MFLYFQTYSSQLYFFLFHENKPLSDASFSSELNDDDGASEWNLLETSLSATSRVQNLRIMNITWRAFWTPVMHINVHCDILKSTNCYKYVTVGDSLPMQFIPKVVENSTEKGDKDLQFHNKVAWTVMVRSSPRSHFFVKSSSPTKNFIMTLSTFILEFPTRGTKLRKMNIFAKDQTAPLFILNGPGIRFWLILDIMSG